MTGSLASVHPELIPEWSEKNLPLTPDKITFGSNKRVWWNTILSRAVRAGRRRRREMYGLRFLAAMPPTA